MRAVSQDMLVLFNQTLTHASLFTGIDFSSPSPSPSDLLSPWPQHLIEVSSPVHPLILLLYAAEFPSFHHKIFPVDLCYIWAQERIMGMVWDFIRDKGKYLMSVSLWKIFHLKILPLASQVWAPLSNLACQTVPFFRVVRNVSRMNLSQVPIAYFIK